MCIRDRKGTIDGRDDSYTQLDNVKYTLDACKLAKKSNCSVFVGAGSQAEYCLLYTSIIYNFTKYYVKV